MVYLESLVGMDIPWRYKLIEQIELTIELWQNYLFLPISLLYWERQNGYDVGLKPVLGSSIPFFF